MAGKFFAGLDQGTTGTTALLADEDWGIVSQGYKEHTLIYPKPGWVEQDPLDIYNSALTSLHIACLKAGINPGQISCIGLCNQGESCLIWNKKTGIPVYNIIIWQDRRTSAYADELAEQAKDLILEKTGLVPDAYFSATKLKWLIDNVPGVTDMLKAGELLAGTLDSWLIWKLTGGRIHITDYTTASRTMLFNIHTGKWDDELLSLLDIPVNILPEVRDSSMVYGYTDPEVFFGASVPITGSVTDQQAALFGQTCFSPGSIKTTYGTGCFMLMNTGDNPVRSANGLLTTIAWRLENKITYALDGGIYVAGAAIHWLRDKLNLFSDCCETANMAESAESNGGVYFVPAFTGLAAPHWDQYARGMIIGLTGGTSKEQIVCAALESVAYQVKDCLDAMNRDTGIPIRAMNVDGGMVNNRFLMQFQADILNIPVNVPVITETTALGAAYLGAFGIGEFNSLSDIACRCALACSYEPKMSEDQRETLLSRWREAVKRSRGWAVDDRLF